VSRSLIGAATALVALLTCVPSQAEYVIPHSVVGTGGSGTAGPSHALVGTLGQPVIGVTSGPANTNEIGFWYQPGWILTGTGEDALPTRYWLGQSYPNPFNPVTTLAFSVPRRSRVTISLYNVAGREVRRVVDEEFDPGFYAETVTAQGLPSGVYFCRMVSGEFTQTRKLTLLK
jgi:hypothetical protein